jgi:hypothetical protein
MHNFLEEIATDGIAVDSKYFGLQDLHVPITEELLHWHEVGHWMNRHIWEMQPVETI